MISNNEQRCQVKTSFMQITTFKDSKTHFMLFTELNSTMTETAKKSKWLKIWHELKKWYKRIDQEYGHVSTTFLQQCKPNS